MNKISAKVYFESKFTNRQIMLYCLLIVVLTVVGFFTPGSTISEVDESSTYFVILNDEQFFNDEQEPKIKPVVFETKRKLWYGFVEWSYSSNYICYGKQIYHISNNNVEKINMHKWATGGTETNAIFFVVLAICNLILFIPVIIRALFIIQSKNNSVCFVNGYFDGCTAKTFGKKRFRIENNNGMRIEIKEDKLRKAEQLIFVQGTQVIKIYFVHDASSFKRDVEDAINIVD